MRNCDGFTEVSRRQLFAVQHRFDVFRLNIAAFHQLFTGKANRLFFVSGFTAQEDILRAQLEQVVITLLKAVFQMVAYFLFISIVALCGNQTFGQAGVQAAIQEVGQRNMLRLRYLTHRALGQVTVSNDQIYIRRQIVNGAVGDGDLAQACILYFLTQYPCAHRAGTHTGIASHDDFTHMAQVVGHVASRQRRGAFRFRFHVMHTTGGRFNVIFFFHFAGFQQNCRNHEGDRHCRHDGSDVSEVSAFWRHRQYRQNGTRRRRRDQTAVQDGQGEYAGHTAKDNGQNQAWVHQHVREVNFVDTAQEVDDGRAARRLFSAAATEEHVRQQDAHPRTRVSFNQEEDGFTHFMGLLDTQR
ncbi:Uncharacterised protein [Salmonella enterica subsp. enterica serovar Typhimurium str. DT104]|nr:Uncharacterised protein [Salmonella enterica subsp. enterica serovar Typhimurium str. DT104]